MASDNPLSNSGVIYGTSTWYQGVEPTTIPPHRPTVYRLHLPLSKNPVMRRRESNGFEEAKSRSSLPLLRPAPKHLPSRNFFGGIHTTFPSRFGTIVLYSDGTIKGITYRIRENIDGSKK
ncbi:macrophage activating glycoprotein [Moniliophthora roreri]|nr:macrophage activating glycoprotein [Moniliophthora roreri]